MFTETHAQPRSYVPLSVDLQQVAPFTDMV